MGEWIFIQFICFVSMLTGYIMENATLRDVGIGALFLSILLPALIQEYKVYSRIKKLNKDGISADGEVVCIERSGSVSRYKQGVKIKARIIYPDGNIGFVIITESIPVVYLVKFLSGSKIKLKFDKDNRKDVVLDNSYKTGTM
ncbi:MAG: hypothetical protein FWD70_01760 [Desulfuromonadales bacterium]|nr:hypothetical protein [Desulfuromonadales bacterium]